MNLDELERRIRMELEFLDYPTRRWMPEHKPGPVESVDVVIVGGGQSGLAAAFGLLREKVDNIVVLDRNPPGTEGPWIKFARMPTLRTPKQSSGLDFGMPNLTPRAWFEARFGREAWDEMTKFPRETWQEYLAWYRRVLDLPVRNNVEVTLLRPQGNSILVETREGAPILARKVILATGIEGGGRWFIPDIVAELPKDKYAHTADQIDFAALRGKRVGVLGAGASAFDNAAFALNAGATRVDLCFRQSDLPRINHKRWIEYSGFVAFFADLPPLDRWMFGRQIQRMRAPPPQDTVWRCTSHTNFALQAGATWLDAELRGETVAIRTPKGLFEFDFLILGTGLISDPHCRPELALMADDIALWRDRFVPPPGEEDEQLARETYLGPAFEFQEKVPGTAPYLRHIHNFTAGANISMGHAAASISGMKYGTPRLVAGVLRNLFIEDSARHLDDLVRYDDPEVVTLTPPADFVANIPSKK
ncbi:NAD(P)/FAD-dependent oxidoreductase [Halotia wernerae UHCC 0503]|jgi:cation diffusion facilitator CzcD-associated flavoprotein CzcO|nr:NAD(P)/FAD-dependent oxidoreductase [Halotia wernerae UHCC 0503]